MSELCNGSCSGSCQNENDTANIHVCNCKQKTVSPVATLSRSYRGCRFYRPIKGNGQPCIINDLCDQRQVIDCPVRIAWAQNIGESDDDFMNFLFDVGSNPSENLMRFINARKGRV